MPEIGDLKVGVSDHDPERLHPLMRYFQELTQQPDFVEHLEGRGVHGIATEIPEEIWVLFQYGHLDTLPCQKITEHHARGAATHHAAPSLQNHRIHANTLPVKSFRRIHVA